MANIFRVDATPGRLELDLSNGGTDVFFDVLTLAGCGFDRTPWEQHLIVMFADGQRLGRGVAGFDLTELKWTADWPAQKAFLLGVVDRAAARYRWDELGYDPPYAAGYMSRYREMVDGYTPDPDAPAPDIGTMWDREDWTVPPEESRMLRCSRHGLYTGYYTECRLGDE